MQITIKGLTKRYSADKYALRDINLTIKSGLFGLLGPNGAGKTTLMRILTTLLKPTSGEVLIDNLDLRRNRKEIRRIVGYLPQEFSTFSKMATWEFLDYVASLSGIRNKKVRMSRVDELLDSVGLYEVRDRRAGKLSGGMKRRLGIAQTLIGDPKVMIVDEPTVGLDPEERLRFRNLLSDLTKGDIIIILSTHIVGDISSTCSEVVLLNQGKVVFDSSPEELLKAAQGKVWKVTVAEHELTLLKETYPVISTVPTENGFEMRLVADEIKDRAAESIDPNLEDAYVFFMQSLGHNMNLEADNDGW